MSDKWIKKMSMEQDMISPFVDVQKKDGTISYGGKHLTSRGGIDVPADAPPVLVAALGPQMLKLVGRVADGTVTWMTGPETIRNHISPVINAAAEEAGRPVPQVIAAVPVCITSDLDMAEDYAK